MSNFDDDLVSNTSANETLEDVVRARVSRRGAIAGGLAAIGGVSALLNSVPASAGGPLLGFTGIAPSSLDEVVVPPGYTAKVLIAWGDPVSSGPEFNQDASNSAEDQAQQWGMHNDGLVYFPFPGSRHGLIVQNHEYTDDVLLFSDGTVNWDAEKTAKSLNAHGVGIIEVIHDDGDADCGFGPPGERSWRVVRPSPFARRITGQTPIEMGGPAAGDVRLQTSADPTGRRVLGTLNNCAMGYTPWGTYLACEENFNGYFRKTGMQTELERRYGINAAGAGYLWHTTDSRFSADAEPNEPNRFGWVVEINPFDPSSTPVKRTALGRLKHEGAWVQEARDGRVVVYSGDDEIFEYIYRFVSKQKWKKAIAKGKSPLDEGVLYVAKFHADGTGEWLPLTPDNPALAGWSLADILINTRGAADAAGATKMDRPEWIDTFPDQLTAIATLTNNSRRGTGTNPSTDAINPRTPNPYGHIIRWFYANDWTENTFGWEIFALAGDPANPATGSTIVGDKYGSPDGIYVAPSGRLWIQTDVSGSTINSGAYAGFGNNQMLCADPATKETRRFLVGPKICEVTGAMMTPDEKTMFVGIQHPGEAPTGVNDPADPKKYSSWPDGAAGGRPRSSLIVITKDDGGVIGS
ncbi:MAG TPA: PhoX family phosphatase [Polyangiaceae bacterium]|nr:PhoX family phosphatase [Polyangiaceae bacterium]